MEKKSYKVAVMSLVVAIIVGVSTLYVNHIKEDKTTGAKVSDNIKEISESNITVKVKSKDASMTGSVHNVKNSTINIEIGD